MSCFDPYDPFVNTNIETYLNEDPDNIVMIIKKADGSRAGRALCYLSSQLRKDINDFDNIFLQCSKKNISALTNFGTVFTGPYLKIRHQDYTFLVNYVVMQEVLKRKERIIYIEQSDDRISLTVSLNAKQEGDDSFVSANHCQTGSAEQLYRILIDVPEALFTPNRAKRYTLSFRSYDDSIEKSRSKAFIIYTDTLKYSWTRVRGNVDCEIGDIEKTLRRELTEYFRESQKFDRFFVIDPEHDISIEKTDEDVLKTKLDILLELLCRPNSYVKDESVYIIAKHVGHIKLKMFITDIQLGA